MFPPEHSLRLIADMIAYTVHQVPKWNPINICSYHLQEAGATPDAGARLRAVHGDRGPRPVKASGQVSRGGLREGRRPDLVLRQRRRAVRRGDVQDARLRRALGRDHPGALRRRGPEDAPVPLRRAGQLARPDRGAAGEQRAADRAGDARRHALEERPRPRRCSCRRGTRRSACPGRGTSSGRCGCSRCSPSSPTCSSTTTSSTARHVIEAKVAELVEGAKAEIDRVQAMGGAIAAVESRLHEAGAGQRARRPPGPRSSPARRRSSASTCFETTEPSPLTADLDAAIMAADPEAEKTALASVEAWKAERDEAEVDRGAGPARGRRQDRHQPDGGRRCAAARAGATTGEWAGDPARGVRRVPGAHGRERRGGRRRGRAPSSAPYATGCKQTGEELGGRLRLLVGKPGLDGHSNGAEQVAVRARDAGFEVIYQGIRLTPEQIVAAAVAEDVHCVGLSILSGSHMELVPAVLDGTARGGPRRRPGHRRRDHPGLRRPAADRAGRRRGLHAQGLRADRDHGRDRGRDPGCARAGLRLASR